MNIVLWVLQGILIIKLVTTAVSHAFQHDLVTMQEAMDAMPASKPLLYAAAVGMFLSGLALLLPAVIQVPSWITPVVAVGISVMMLISAGLHVVARENPTLFAVLILSALAAFLAYGRWMLSPM